MLPVPEKARVNVSPSISLYLSGPHVHLGNLLCVNVSSKKCSVSNEVFCFTFKRIEILIRIYCDRDSELSVHFSSEVARWFVGS